MGIAQQAIEEADQIISSLVETVVGLSKQSIRERRKEAPWRYVRAQRRAAYATTKAARRYWLWRARKWRAIAEANKAYPDLCCSIDNELAKMPERLGSV